MDTLELARMEELDLYDRIIEMGRAFQRAQGFVQWTEAYPSRDTLREDIQAQKGYVLRADGAAAGYLCIDFDGEPAYADIRGRWRTEGPYAVVHRMAFHEAFRGKGLTASAFRLIEAMCAQRGVRAIRVDTDPRNRRMQHLLEANGFVPCGTVLFQGSEKWAYDKAL